MVGLDTNILVRLATGDDPAQVSRIRERLVALRNDGRLFHVTLIVLNEFVWVLRAAYGQPREAIGHALDLLLRDADFVVEASADVRTALSLFREGKADFADALIGLINRHRGCSTTLTLDRKAARLPDFERLT